MDISQSATTDNLQESRVPPQGPKRFIFNVPEDRVPTNNTEFYEIQLTKESSIFEESIPFISNFPEPKDYKEGYKRLANNILGVYNHIRLMITGECYDEIKPAMEKVKVEQVSDCLLALKELFITCYDSLQKGMRESKKSVKNDLVKDYEDLLQKAESKIRVFIRNEQIYRLNFDMLTQRVEDAEKALSVAHYEINMGKSAYDTLNKEKAELVTKLQQKDDQIKKLQKEYEEVEKKYKESRLSLNTVENQEPITCASDHKVVSPQTWEQSLFSMTMRESKQTPTGAIGRMSSDADRKNYWSEMRQQSSARHLGTERVQERRANIAGASFLNASSENSRKTERSKISLITELKKTIDSHRNALNASSETGLNKSIERSQERNTINGGIFNVQKLIKENLNRVLPQDHVKIKFTTKERTRETRDKDLSSFLANKPMIQKINNLNSKFDSIQIGAITARRSRDTSILTRNNNTHVEYSPDATSQDSKAFRSQGNSNLGLDVFNSPYATTFRQKTLDTREEKNQTRPATKSSLVIKNMIAEQLSRKLNGNKFA